MMPEDIGAPKGHRIYQQLLQAEKVRFVGDRVAFVVAETQAQARDAAEMIEVDYETLPAVALLEDAAKDGAPKVWDDNPNGNVAFMLVFGDQAATDAAFAKAKHVVKLRMENNRVTPVSMEPRVTRLFSMRSFTTCFALANAASVASWSPNASMKATLPFGLSSHTFGAPSLAASSSSATAGSVS